MPKALQDTLVSLRELLLTAGPVVLLAALLLFGAYRLLDPTPPRRVVLATGAPQSAAEGFGRRYAAYLAQHGVEVELRDTQGAADNLALLRDPQEDVDLALLQGGADERDPGAEVPADEPALVSLGSLFYEPVWFFYRDEAARRLLGQPVLERIGQLRGWRVQVGPPGSGMPVLMDTLLEVNQLGAGEVKLSRQPATPAVMELLAGRADAVVFASAPESPMVQMLLAADGIRLFDFAQAEAYARRFPYLSPLLLPRGIVDLAGDRPPQDVRLIAPTATLAARAGTHPAVLQLFMQAAERVHGGTGWFQRKGDFPNARNLDLPLADEARRFHASGEPVLQRWLPFWLANLVDRMWPALLSIVAVLIPLSRIVPPLYEFRIRRRVFRWYAQLRDIDAARGRRTDEALLDELAHLDERVGTIHVPLSHADELYALRANIAQVRRRIESGSAEPESGPDPAAARLPAA